MKMSRKIIIYSAGIVSLFFIVLFVFSNFKSSYLYKYNVRNDYVYDFSNSSAQVSEVVIKDNRIELPEFDDEWNTAILELKVNSTFLGRFFQPRIYFKSEKNPHFRNYEQTPALF